MATKGIYVDIGGNVAPLNKALQSANKSINATQKELNQVNKLLKLDPSNTDLLAQRQELLKKKIADTADKVTALKNAKSQADEAMKNGTEINQEEYRKLEREIISGENSLKDLKDQSARTEDAIEKCAEGGTVEFDDLTGKIKQADDAAEKASKGGFTVMKGALANLASAGIQKVVSGLKGFLSSGIELASDLTEVQNVVDVTFGDKANVINNFAKSAANAFGMSELQAKQFTGTIGAMLKSMGLSSGEVLNMSQSITGLAGDFASFYNLQPEEAFEKIRSGISGETEPLKQLGINMSVANLEAFGMSQGLNKAYSEMTQSEQALLRYNYLMSVSNDAQGDFSRTSDSFANQQKILQMNLDSVSAEIGSQLLPVLNDLMVQFNAFIQSPQGKQFLQDLSSGIAGLASALANVVTFVVENQELVLGVITAITAAVIAFKIAQLAANVAMLASPITWIILGITALIAIIVLLIKKWKSVKKTVKNVWDGICDALSTAWEFIKDIFKKITNHNIDVINGIIGGVEWLINKVIDGVNWGIGKINQMLSGITDILAHIGINVNWQVPNVGQVSIPRVPYLWKGGIVGDGASAIVGDRGPEQLTVQNGKAVVTPLNSMAAKGGANGISVNIAEFNNYDTTVDTNALADTVAQKIEFKARRVSVANGY